ncbi:MAG TPA: integrase arm-type DNA-binding domain-containing protein [Cellvibrionaceae bacterium]
MPKIVAPLRDAAIAQAKPREKMYKLSDGGGLFLFVGPTGSKLWRVRYFRPDGKESLASLGEYPVVSLAQARVARDAFLAKLAAGEDPVRQKREIKTGSNNFEAVAKAWWEKKKKRWDSNYAEKVWRRFEMHLLPQLGAMPITKIEPPHIVAALATLEASGIHHLASRIRQYAIAVFRSAVQAGLIRYNPATELAGIAQSTKSKHHAALPLEKLPEFLSRIDGARCQPTTRFALLIALHIFVRSSELRNARWTEFDFEKKMWTLPAEREEIDGGRFTSRGAKMKTPHLIPLSGPVIALLQQLREYVGDEALLFPGNHKAWVPISENTLGQAIRNIGYCTQADVTPHGFRTMACSALNESRQFGRDAIERQMAHLERNTVRAAYMHKAEFLEERRLMMDWWSSYLSQMLIEYVDPWEYKGFTGLGSRRERE